MPRRKQNLDFQIHVDPSCLSEDSHEEPSDSMSAHDENKGMENLLDMVEGELKQRRESQHHNIQLEETSANDMEEVSSYSDEEEQQEESTHEDERHHSQEHDQSATSDSQYDHSALDNADGSILDNENSFLEDDRTGDSESHYDRSAAEESLLSQDDQEDSALSLQHEADVHDFGDPYHSPDPVGEPTESPTEGLRRTSGRTEALIHAAAQDVLAQMKQGQFHGEDEQGQKTTFSGDDSICDSVENHHEADTQPEDQIQEEGEAQNQQMAEDDHVGLETTQNQQAAASDTNEDTDDVFSERSPRSSLGSRSASDNEGVTKPQAEDDVCSQTKSPRVSDISRYTTEEFVPTVRDTPRPAFRSPSSVKAMQMSSPPASVLAGPRSSRRTLPNVSRVGSPSYMAQHSPKRTPPRFKRNTPPLVLLHVTLVPLRWAWGEVLDGASSEDLSQEARVLREAWRQLQDRVGDTVLERGILLPHPQNDYEVLEERLLEALELPVRRRARILECGHYLGPANEYSLLEGTESETDDEDEDVSDDVRPPRRSRERDTHWCGTCRSDIRYDPLGVGKVFRVKVYASNGLMKAGAWEACWKEMERVDVELEPVMDFRLQQELDRLLIQQEMLLEDAVAEDVPEPTLAEDMAPVERELDTSHVEEMRESRGHSMPPPEILVDDSHAYDDRLRQDEERLREIYGAEAPLSPPPSSGKTLSPDAERSPESTTHSPQYSFVNETPGSPSLGAFERRQERRSTTSTAQVHKGASLPQLVFEAMKLLLQDRKNVMIGVLSVFVMMLAVRSGKHSAVQHLDDPLTVMAPRQDVPATLATTASVGPTATGVNDDEAHEAATTSVSLETTAVPDMRVLSTSTVYETVWETIRVTQTETETVTETMSTMATATLEADATETTMGMGGESVSAEEDGDKLQDVEEAEQVDEVAEPPSPSVIAEDASADYENL